MIPAICPYCKSKRTYFIGGLLDYSRFRCQNCRGEFGWKERGKK